MALETGTDRSISLLLYPLSVFSAIGFGFGLTGLVIVSQFSGGGHAFDQTTLSFLISFISFLSGPIIAGYIGLHLSAYEHFNGIFFMIFLGTSISFIIMVLMISTIITFSSILLEGGEQGYVVFQDLISVLLMSVFTGLTSVTISYQHSSVTETGVAALFN